VAIVAAVLGLAGAVLGVLEPDRGSVARYTFR
jgi:hypothetical protein